VLAMEYIDCTPIESLETAPQDVRDTAMERLIRLTLHELLDWRLMQTDPNFANYRWQAETGRIVLLDFGAARAVPQVVADGYRRLLAAGLAGQRDAVRDATVQAGFLGEAAVVGHRPQIDRMIDVILAEMNRTGPFDFGDRSFVSVLRDEGAAIARDRSTWHIPSADMLFVQRKISGTALLAARLKARVDVRAMVEPYC
jgi:predicted unusual protein kinase regulating ubiquinone biosynthesis (AarF/ABC1/UbiB family)